MWRPEMQEALPALAAHENVCTWPRGSGPAATCKYRKQYIAEGVGSRVRIPSHAHLTCSTAAVNSSAKAAKLSGRRRRSRSAALCCMSCSRPASSPPAYRHRDPSGAL